MRIPDSQLEEWYRLVLERDVPAGEPMEAKLALARAIAGALAWRGGGDAAEAHFTRVVREGQAPDDVPGCSAAGGRSRPLAGPAGLRFGLSTSEARRLIDQGWREAGRHRRHRSSIFRAARLVDATAPGGQAALRRDCAKSVDGSGRLCYCSSAARKESA